MNLHPLYSLSQKEKEKEKDCVYKIKFVAGLLHPQMDAGNEIAETYSVHCRTCITLLLT